MCVEEAEPWDRAGLQGGMSLGTLVFSHPSRNQPCGYWKRKKKVKDVISLWEFNFGSAHKWKGSEPKLFPQGTSEFRVFVYGLITNKTTSTFKNSPCAL